MWVNLWAKIWQCAGATGPRSWVEGGETDIGGRDLRKTYERRSSIRVSWVSSTIQTRFSDAISSRFRRMIPSGARSWIGHLMLLGVVLLTLPAGCGPRPPDRVLLVSIDTLRADHVGCYGATRAHTPQMDEIGARGVRFAATLSPAPLTLPAHVSLMTALDPPAHGVRHNSIYRLNEKIPTLAERMREAGFATAAFVGAVVLDPRFGLARGFDHYDDRMESRVSGLVGYAERRADRVVDAALAWIRQAPPRFFLWVHLYDPHASYDPPPGFASAFASRPYDGEIAFADAELGRLLAGIRGRWGESGLVVVVTSDHGESLGEHAEPTHSYTIYDATQRVPLLMSGPGLAAGRVIEAQVRLIDVAPTLLGLVGAAPLTGVAGMDLRPLIAGSEREERIAYLETLATQIDFRWSPLLGLRTGRFKYIRAPRPELYDLVADPGETINRADDEPDRVAALDLQLSALLKGMAEMAAARSPGALVELSKPDRERLRSLGYLARDSGIDAADLGKIGGPDPKDSMGILGSIARAEGLLGEGRAAEALAELDSLDHPGVSVDAMRAAAAVALGRNDDATRFARAVLAQEPGRSDVWILLGRALEAQRKLPEAQRAFEQAVRIDVSASGAWTGIGRVLELRERPAAAETVYERARATNVRNDEPVWRLAALRMGQGRREEAQALIAAIPPAAVSGPIASLRLAEAEIQGGYLEAATARLSEAREAHPDQPRLALALGDCLESAGHLESALAEREAALVLAPSSPLIENAVAWNLALLGRELDRALALAERAVAASDGEPHLQDTLATVLMARGAPSRVLTVAGEALDAAPSDLRGHLHYLRAEALSLLDRPEAARRALALALAAEGARSEAWRRSAQSLSERLGG